MAEIRITCDYGPEHEKRGPRNIIVLRRLTEPGLDGALWREVPIESNRQLAPNEPVLNAERGRRETVITPDGERLTGVFAGRTRSRNAATYAGHDPDRLIGSTLYLDLRCSSCGLDPAISSENLDLILNGLHDAGHEQITLKLLEAAAHRLQR